jgi:EpsI family protein
LAAISKRHIATLGAVLTLQAVGFYALPSGRAVPLNRPLAALPAAIGDWTMVRETPMDPEVNRVLRADATLNRDYVNAMKQVTANLFVAYFESQRQGQTPHSPQHCMPGAGWSPESLIAIPIAVGGRTYHINRYVLLKGGERNVVLYWYQGNGRIIASEYKAKMYLVADAVRYNRTDAALVRVVVRVPENGSVERGTAQAVSFVQSLFAPLQQCLPPARRAFGFGD